MSNVPNQNSLGSAPGELPQREERLRKNFLCFLCRLTFPQGRFHRENKEKLKYPKKQNSLGLASRIVSTERRKTKKNFLWF